MKVFISWSGERSRRIAEVLHQWTPLVINAAEPWLSTADIDKGARWSIDVAATLEQCSVGILCVTAENQFAPWLIFEAGALSKSLSAAYVCPLLVDLAIADLSGPLTQFQCTTLDKQQLLHLLSTINQSIDEGQGRVNQEQLNRAFETCLARAQ